MTEVKILRRLVVAQFLLSVVIVSLSLYTLYMVNERERRFVDHFMPTLNSLREAWGKKPMDRVSSVEELVDAFLKTTTEVALDMQIPDNDGSKKSDPSMSP